MAMRVKRTSQDRLFTIGQVAKRLGRSVDFVRRLDREGFLKSEPHRKGEHRRYREQVVAAYQAKQDARRRRTLTPVPSKPPRRSSAVPNVEEDLGALVEGEPPEAWIDAGTEPSPAAWHSPLE